MEGAEKSLLELAEFLLRLNKIEPLIILPRNGRFASVLRKKKIPFLIATRIAWWVEKTKFRNWVLGPLKWMWNYFSWYLIRNKVKKFGPEIVYINTLVTPFGIIAAKDLDIPMVWHAREFIPRWLDSDYDFGRKWSLQKVAESSAVIGNSFAVLEDISDYIPRKKSHVVYNGISPCAIDYTKAKLNTDDLLEERPIRLLMLGSINENKDQITAVKCLAQLKRISLPAELTLAGEEKGDYGSQVRALAQKLDVHQNIIWKGWQNNVEPLFEKTHFMLVCSKGEPFGRTIIESMAYGTPVICSDSGGAPEIVKQVDPGLLFKEGDVNALAEIITNLIQNRAWYNAILMKGRKVVENNFDIETHGQKIFDILQSVVRTS